MPYFDQNQYDLRCEWGLAGVQQIAPSDVIIIVDILSFSTSVDVLLGRGATVFPYRWNDDSATQYARERNAELASSRSRCEGPYSLAPSSLVDAPAGLRLVLPSPNGSSLSYSAMSSGAVVLAGCFRNASAVAKQALQLGKRITVVPAGERWADGTLRFAIEDWMGAGAIIGALTGRCSPEANLAATAYKAVAPMLTDHLQVSSSGRELAERGFSRDLELAAEVDVSRIVPIMKGEEYVSFQA